MRSSSSRLEVIPRDARSVVIHEGESRIDGAPLVVVATGLRGDSANDKTKAMIQTWILRRFVHPHRAAMTGRDRSICGSCPHRLDPETGTRSCYVRTEKAPTSIWKAYRRGSYPRVSPAALGEHAAAQGLKVRIGAYGDPGAVPIHVWQPIVRRAPGVTGYSHLWRTLSPAWAQFVMASADSAEERFQAQRRGFRSFRIADEPGPGEILCPSSRGVSCADCALCDGLLRGDLKSIVNPPHGRGEHAIRRRWGTDG